MSIILRAMQPEDVAKVYEIERSISPDPWSEKLFSDCISVGYSCWVLEKKDLNNRDLGSYIDSDDDSEDFSDIKKNNEIVGYGLLSCAASEAHVLNIAIKQNMQRLGLGRRMMQHLIQQASSLQADIIYLEVRETNLPAITLYKQLAFIEIGSRKGYYARGNDRSEREDAIVLALGL